MMTLPLHSTRLPPLSGAPALAVPVGAEPGAVEAYGLRCEHRERPMEVDVAAPLLSWRLASSRPDDGPAATRVLLAEDPRGLAGDAAALWDSGPLADPAACSVLYGGPPLRPRSRLHWRVAVTDRDGATRHADAWFETGLQDPAAWTAGWIAHDVHALDPVDPPETGEAALEDFGLSPCALLRRRFALQAPPTRARVYVTARGLYELRINGERAGDAQLAPGWTDYRRRIAYRGYDVTAAVRAGDNVLAATLADGWYAGFVGFDPRRPGAHYGRVPQLLAELHLDFADGRHEVIATDERWRTARGGTRYADLLMGESHDPRRDPDGWDRPGYDDASWAPAVVADRGVDHVEAAIDEPVRAMQEIRPISVRRAGAGRHVVDLGQNVAGRVRLRLRHVPAGRRVVLRHAEVLDDAGELYVANLRTAAATDVVWSTGAAEQRFEPRFTYHGFRYVEVSGLDELDPDDLTAVVLHSDTPWAGDFACSDPEITQLWHNIAWGQRGNFVSVPTDCPQRDERLGWLADAQVFLPTAALNADVTAFFVKWLADVRDAQSHDGAFSNVAPRLAGVADDGAPGWGDAGVLVPWHLYRVTGDARILQDNLDAMLAWVGYVHRHNPELIWRERVGPHFADWLSIGPPTDRDLVATAYFAHSAECVARAAAVVGREPQAAEMAALAARIRARFAEMFVAPDGRVRGETQTAYALALAFGLVPEELTERAADRLAAVVRDAGPAITTGFLGVGLLAGVLDSAGHPDLAHALLARREHPSWLYPIGQGATTIWERWDGFTPQAGFQAPSMNSFNHYALGSVGAWLYQGVAGLDQAPESVGYHRLRVRPRPGPLRWARASYESVRGRIAVAWERADGRLRLDVDVPPGVEATVHVPTPDPAGVTVGGVPATDAPSVDLLAATAGEAVLRVGSGRWRFGAGDPDAQWLPEAAPRPPVHVGGTALE